MRQRASVTLEFVLMAPILAVLLMGLIEWGLVFAQEVALIQVVKEAAHTGARAHPDASPSPQEQARARARAALATAGLPNNTATVLAQVEPSAIGQVMHVRVQLPHAPLFSLLPSVDQLSAETTMRMEHQ